MRSFSFCTKFDLDTRSESDDAEQRTRTTLCNKRFSGLSFNSTNLRDLLVLLDLLRF